jgi:hypothetical protein
MAGINSITGAGLSSNVKWVCQNNLTGVVYNPISNTGSITKNYNISSAAGNAASGGCDEVFSFQQTIAGNGSVTINLNNMTNILQQTAITLARIKGYQIRLLSVSDDSTITAPTASAVTVTNNGPATPNPLDFQTGGSGLTLTIGQSAGVINSCTIGGAGSGYPPSSFFNVSPQQSGGSGAVIYVTTNASGVPTGTTIISGGTGYTNGTVPSVVLGQYIINNGGAHLYFDVSAAGFVTVSTTSNNIKVFNNDPANTATIEITVFGATT